MLPLTLLTSFYGMNVTGLPLAETNYVFWFMWISVVCMLSVYLILRSKWKF
jgi:Mg2+ and Co2+ transporter CorA